MDTKNPSKGDGFMGETGYYINALIIKSLYQISRFIINIVNLGRRRAGGRPFIFIRTGGNRTMS